ncbi:MAG: dihydrolipoamide dehydrogenase [Solirubrobacteraceae bacterium]|nr:dihydrolipoamide dehydrogenase [Solirubrobacteraceae bacterium]
MSEVRVPDIGDFTDVPVIEIHVAPGDEVAAEDPLVTLESDKATMDVPAPAAGTIAQLRVSIGDRVSEGSVLLTLESNGASPAPAAPESPSPASVQHEPAPPPPSPSPSGGERDAQVVVLGSGPGGYTAAFRAADLGLRTVLVERYERLGGVCLNVGCIPSKALLHAARLLAESEEMAEHGISFGTPTIDLTKLIDWKSGVVAQLTGGLASLAKQRKVEVVHGSATFSGPHTLAVGEREISFDSAIIAAGSQAAMIPDLPDDPRIVDSTGALSPSAIPGRLLVIGGGIIGLEMACVYDALGAKVTVVEMLDELMTGADPDLVKPLARRIESRYSDIMLGARVAAVKAQKNGLKVEIEGIGSRLFDQILIAVGRVPNGRAIGADAAGVAVDERGFVSVDEQMRTNVPHIYAIGDIVGGPMLAHKATHEAKVAAEVIAGRSVAFDPRSIPSVAYTDPEVAWTGLTETAARAGDVAFDRVVFPWAASGRALALGRSEGYTKLLVEPDSRRVLGCGIVGVGAGDLIAEAVHAIEMGADAEDLALTIHPHPTLSETVGFAAEMADGSITDLMPPRGRSSAAR